MIPSQKKTQQDQGQWVVLHVQEEVYRSTLTFRSRVAKYHMVSIRCPKLRIYDISPSTKHKRGVKSQGYWEGHFFAEWVEGILVKALFCQSSPSWLKLMGC